MYSGITAGLYEVIQLERCDHHICYVVEADAAFCEDLHTGDSVAVDGVCQTVVDIVDYRITFEAMLVTQQKTTLGALVEGRLVSLARSLRFGEEVGGHLSAGHVAGCAVVDDISQDDGYVLTLQIQRDWCHYLYPLGFVTLDGSSLTVVDVDYDAATFRVALIPETLRRTNFGCKRVGDRINIEFDAISKQVADTLVRIQAQAGVEKSF